MREGKVWRLEVGRAWLGTLGWLDQGWRLEVGWSRLQGGRSKQANFGASKASLADLAERGEAPNELMKNIKEYIHSWLNFGEMEIHICKIIQLKQLIFVYLTDV